MFSHIIRCLWISSSLDPLIRNRTQAHAFNERQSTRSTLDCGVLQGSVLGPLLYLLYTADVTAIAKHHRLVAHSYADDTQLYVCFKHASNHEWSAGIALCIEEIEKQMTSNRLKLNSDKTQLI